MPVQHYKREERVREMYNDYKLRRRMRIHDKRMIGSRKIKRSQQQMMADHRKTRVVQAKDSMKQAVRIAKTAGKAIEYRGPLSRANIVSLFRIQN